MRGELSAKGLARAAWYSWESAAAQTVSAYEEVAATTVARSPLSRVHARRIP
jgi:hypothetical protein